MKGLILLILFMNWDKDSDMTTKLSSLFYIQIVDEKNEYLYESTLVAG